MIFDVTKTVSFDLEDDLADRVLTFVECDMWYDHPLIKKIITAFLENNREN